MPCDPDRLYSWAQHPDIIEWAERSKTPVVVAFLDFEKAFDRVRWHYL
jgi:hypothetical protein